MSDIGAKVITSLRWFTVIKILSQAFSWIITFYIMSILVEADYGLFAMATVVISFMFLVSELGLSSALMQKKDITVKDQRQIFGLVLIVGIALTTVISLAAPYIAEFYRDERLTTLIMMLGSQFLLIPFYVVPKATLERNLNFKVRSIIELVSSIISSFTTLLCATYGLGVWALILGHMTTIICHLIGYNYANPFRHLPTFNFKGVSSMLSFGGFTMGSRWLWFFSSNADMIIAGRLLAIDTVGLYKFATHIASLPAQKISPIINQIAFPAFARMQDDKEQVASHYLKAVGLLSLISFPILWGIASIADFIPNYLGEHWRGAIPALRVLCFVLPLRMLNGLTPSITGALGHPAKDFKNQVWLFVIMVSAYYIGCEIGGLMGLVYAWAIGFPLVVGRNLFYTLPIIGLTLTDLLKQMITPLILATIMMFSIFGIQHALTDISQHILFALSIVSGIIIYSALTLAFNRDMGKMMLKFVKK
ncbi:MAG: lipopolysaccharide biosynthesis protein [Gammaproteobacteria bacterium]|nr:MAG: lipopolysaccharide biosynthesis protein [Gammaproteobacteria bacterium]